ncbi:MAG: class I SAM-dependent methyltransferase [Candidatus Bathyarchaeia archaeon]|jgi:SAM-dependent methyltransferase
MENEKASSQKIYGYDEELWHRLLKESDKTGDQAVKRLLPLMQEYSAGKRILDLGCGVGRISNRLALRGYEVVGIDLSPLCIADAKKNAQTLGIANKTRYIVSDFTKLEGLGTEKFDIVVCINAPAWKTPFELTSFFSGLTSFMHPNALLIIQDTLKEAFLHALYSAPNVQNWYREEGGVLSLHSWRYNPQTATVSMAKEFYERTPDGLSFITKLTGESKLRSIADYTSALNMAGWIVMQVNKPAVNLLNLEAFNDPWLINTATIVAHLKTNVS